MIDESPVRRLLEQGLRILEVEGPESAAKTWGRIFDLDPSPPRFREFADAARRALRERRHEAPSPWEPALDALMNRTDEGRAGDWEASIEKWVADYGDDARLLYACGKVVARLGDSDRARRLFARACERDPRSSEALARLAGIETRDGRHERAIELARRALTIDPFDVEAHRALLISAALSGDVSVVTEFASRARLVLGDSRFVTSLCDEATTRRDAAQVRFQGGDGRDLWHPIRVEGARSSEVGQCAERLYAEKLFGQGWDVEGQELVEESGRLVDCLVLQRNSETRRLYFDVTDCVEQAEPHY
ncbi:MAG: tetratricopeptide repeat protein [Planctomycetes bacterium]|nr:tetratricopeptide repeat protein [Planctomycetota bacterium]